MTTEKGREEIDHRCAFVLSACIKFLIRASQRTIQPVTGTEVKTTTDIDHNTKKINFIILFCTISVCEQRVGWQQWSFLTSLLFFFPTTMNSILIQWPNSYSSTSKRTKPIATTVLNGQPVNLKPMSATPVLTPGILTKMVKLRDFHNHQFKLKEYKRCVWYKWSPYGVEGQFLSLPRVISPKETTFPPPSNFLNTFYNWMPQTAL